ncbi:MAG: hypothetical protein HQ517_02330 [SAR324 cluster bacterium]|nr:hypothetical protein [SAR324 cluster bacterium]
MQISPVRLFEDHLDRINSVISRVCSRRDLSKDEIEDIRSFVHGKLLLKDCKVLRDFDESKISSNYLLVVINNLVRDYFRSEYGRWRSSTKAKALGDTAIRLEELLYRRNYPLESAIETISTETINRGENPPSSEYLMKLADQIKIRQQSVTFSPGDTVLSNLAVSRETAAEALIIKELIPKKKKLDCLLQSLHAELPDEVRLIFKMRFQNNHKISVIARILGRKRPQVERLINNTLAGFKRQILKQGFNQEEILEILENIGKLDTNRSKSNQPIRDNTERKN